MKHHFEMFSIFTAFYAEIQTQCNVPIWVLCGDNALDICKHHLNLIWHQEGLFTKPLVPPTTKWSC